MKFRCPQEGHLIIGKEVCIPLSTLMIMLEDNSEFHLDFLGIWSIENSHTHKDNVDTP